MKKTVFIVVVICTVLLGGIFVIGFLQKQLKESSLSTTSTDTSPASNSSSQANNTPSSSQASAGYTMAEIAKHSLENNCWLLINNKVYDVTKFIPDHPGGVSQIIPYCGKEASKAFDTQGGRGRSHSPTADEMLKDYYIGNLSQ